MPPVRPKASSLGARHTMQANRSVSNVEVLLRHALWRDGPRGYRLHPPLPGRPDLVFGRHKLAVFVHGCYWHQCPDCSLPVPKANREFWTEKFAATEVRDAAVMMRLRDDGWDCLVIWEHEIRSDVNLAAARVRTEVERRANGGTNGRIS
jgi:DNA mismatch endonuclease (patch repair protein)